MGAFSFIVKTVCLTAVLIWALQFRVDNKPAEKHFIDFVRSSSLTQPIHKIAEGSRKLANDTWGFAKNLVGSGETDTSTKTNETARASSFRWQAESEDSSVTEE